MTRTVLWASLTLMLGILVGLLIVHDAGYVLVAFDTYTVETSVWVALFVLALVVTGIRLLQGFVRSVASGGNLLAGVIHKARRQDAAHYLYEAMRQEADNQFERAVTSYRSAMKRAPDSVFLWLRAATAANQAGDHTERDRLMDEAKTKFPKFSPFLDCHFAELLHASGQRSEAWNVLDSPERKSDSVAVLEAKARLLRQDEDWSGLIPVLSALLKKGVGDVAALRSEWMDAHNQELKELARSGADEGRLKSAWTRLSKELKKDSDLFRTYCESLVSVGRPEEAAGLLIKRLRKSYEEPLARLLGALPTPPQDRIKSLGAFARNHPESPAAHLGLGRALALVRDLDGAREALQKSLDLQSSAETLEELAQVEVHAQQHERAAELLRRAAEMRSEKAIRHHGAAPPM